MREALLNLFGRGSRMYPLVALAAILGSASSAYAAFEATRLISDVEALAAQGRNVLVISSLDPEAPTDIGRASCESLQTTEGVTTSGALVPVGELTMFPIGGRLQASKASATLIPQLGTSDVVIGRDLAPGVDRSFFALTDAGPVTAAPSDQYPTSLGIDYSVTIPMQPSDVTVEQCVILLTGLSDAATALPIALGQLDVSGNPASGRELLVATSDPVLAYLERPTRWFPLLLGFFGALVTAVVIRTRASEIAVYRMSGTSPTSIAMIVTIEALLLGGVAASSATIASLALSPRYLDPGTPILAGLVLAGAWVLTVLVSSLDLALRRPGNLAKDR